ncbi:hypothetical protein ACOMHN_047074 [Nucella lapillus]
MQPNKLVTSRPRHQVLSRSQSLAFPLTDIDHLASLDSRLNASPPGKKKGIVSSMLIVESGSLDGDSTEGLHQAGNHFKKSMRRQKSLAELFGRALYRSKVHLHELFSRRDRSGKIRQKKPEDGQVLFGQPPLETRKSEAAGSEDSGTDTQSPVSAAIVCGDSTATQPRLIPREPVVVECVNHSVSNVHNTEKQSSCRVPEELFCVSWEPRELPVSLPEQKLPHSQQDVQQTPTLKANRPSSTSDGHTARTVLKKSHSDSLWQVGHDSKPVPDACLPKPSWNGTPGVHRTRVPQNSKRLPRDSKVGVMRTTSASPPSVWRSEVSSTCIHPIVDWLWVGSVEAAYNEPLLCTLKVDAIVDLTNVDPYCVPAEKRTTCRCACRRTHFCAKLKLAVDDIEWESIDQYFPDTNAFIHGWRQRGSRVLVVSYHGKSRAPAFVTQHLMQHFRISLDTALAHVRSRWPQTRLNPGFVRVLQRLDRRLAQQREFSDLSAPEFPPP